MRKYLATLHTKPDHHKKRFAFLVSGGVTLFLFMIWTLVTFGEGGTLAQTVEENNNNEVSPFESISAGAGESVHGLQENFKALINSYGG